MTNSQLSPDIAIFLPSLEGGGAERVMSILANGFAARGHKVDLVLVSAHGPYISKISPHVRIVELGSGTVSRSIIALTRYMRREQPKALLAALSHANVIAIIAHALAGSRARLVVSERLSLSAARKYSRGFRDRIIRALMRITYHRADRIVVVASAMIRELHEYLNLPTDRIQCIYNPVVDNGLVAAAEEPCTHPWMRPGEVTPVILACGRLTEQKDFTTLLEAFRIVRARRPVRLIVLGEGEERAALLAQAEIGGMAADISLPGFAANPFAFMKRADVFVLSSIYEGMPGALIQAMACGAPVVSTNCPTGPDEILEHGKWGYLVEMRDPNAMADAIERALTQGGIDARHRASAFSEVDAVGRYLEALGFEYISDPCHAQANGSFSLNKYDAG